MSDKMKNLEYVRNSLPRRVLLEGLAEECCELAQAALKSIRADDGTNPTPVSKEACLDKLNEEAGDVLMLLELLDMIPCGSTLDNPKWERWANRIKERERELIVNAEWVKRDRLHHCSNCDAIRPHYWVVDTIVHNRCMRCTECGAKMRNGSDTVYG